MNLPAAKFTLSPKVTEGLFLGRILLFTIPPSRLREPPPVHYRPIIHLKGVTHYTLQARRVKKDREISHSLSFSVGANCVRPRAFTERPYGWRVNLSLFVPTKIKPCIATFAMLVM